MSTLTIDRVDSLASMGPAMSLVNDQDLHYYNEYKAFEMSDRYFRPTSEGMVGNHAGIGLSLFLVPSIAISQLGPSAEPTYTPRTQAALHSTTLLWAALTMLALILLIRRSGGSPEQPSWRTASLISVALYLGTPLAFYTHIQGIRPHLLESLLATLLILQTIRRWNAPTVSSLLGTGLCAGLLAMVRLQAALLIVFPMAAALYRLRAAMKGSNQETNRREILTREGTLMLALVAPTLSGWLLQRSVGKLLYGSGNTRPLIDSLFLVDFNLADVLIHPHHGLFTWSPIFVIGFAGIALLVHRRRELLLPVCSFLLIQWYLNGTSYDQLVDQYQNTRHWAGGASFGSRRFLNCLPLLALGIAELTTRLHSTRWRFALWGAIGATVVWSCALALAARIDLGGVIELPMTGERLVNSAWQGLSSAPQSFQVALNRAPPLKEGAAGMLVALAFPLFLGASWFVISRGLAKFDARRRKQILFASGAILLAGSINIALTVAENTRATRDASTEMAAFIEKAESNAWLIQRAIWVEQARLRVMTDDVEGALSRYSLALELGVQQSDLSPYLELALKHGGPSEAQARMQALLQRHPNNRLIERTLRSLNAMESAQ